MNALLQTLPIGPVVSIGCGVGFAGQGGSPPAAPTGLMASSGDSGHVPLIWTASSGAASYNVYQGGVLIATNVATTSYNATGLVNGTPYTFYVTAVNAGGESSPSNTATGTPANPPPPDAPTGLVATPGNNHVSLTWDAVPEANTYSVYNNGTLVVAFLTSTVYLDASVSNGDTFDYTVTASNGGGESAQSNDVPGTVQFAPYVVTAPQIVSDNGAGGGTLELAQPGDTLAVNGIGDWFAYPAISFYSWEWHNNAGLTGNYGSSTDPNVYTVQSGDLTVVFKAVVSNGISPDGHVFSNIIPTTG